MGAIRSSATALLSAGATGLALALGAFGAPAGLAAEEAPATSFAFAVTPSTVAPGGTVTLSVSNCGASSATASSGIFDTVTIERGRTVKVTVDRDARPGALYSVTFTCDGENGSADLTITGGTTQPSTSSTSAPRRTPSPTATATSGTGLRPPPPVTRPPRTTQPARTTPPARIAPPPRTPPARPTPPARTTPVPRATATATARATTTTLGVRGGLGGSITGTDRAQLAAGAGLFLLATAGGAAYALRRRRAARGH
ncbi:hypothetical protein ACFYZT_00810 [Streptomyces sp. NPDC001591]|uniref:hypothetical protein n=1 Tax=Streptomyces sp. NPDC001591 TaxID=3364589 RepID=UPI0036AA6A7A